MINKYEVRAYTNKLRELCDEGVLSYENIFNEFMCYLSEDEVKTFCLEGFGGELTELFNDDKEEVEE